MLLIQLIPMHCNAECNQRDVEIHPEKIMQKFYFKKGYQLLAFLKHSSGVFQQQLAHICEVRIIEYIWCNNHIAPHWALLHCFELLEPGPDKRGGIRRGQRG